MDSKADPIARFSGRWVLSTNGCWIWAGRLKDGYGRIVVDGEVLYAHRYAWRLYKGPIPEGMVIDHICMDRRCVNPSHLCATTMPLNSGISAWRRRLAAGKPVAQHIRDKYRI